MLILKFKFLQSKKFLLYVLRDKKNLIFQFFFLYFSFLDKQRAIYDIKFITMLNVVMLIFFTSPLLLNHNKEILSISFAFQFLIFNYLL